MAKRAGGEVAAPSAKRAAVLMAPLDIGPASGQEDLNLKVLQVQNRKLSERLRERNFAREQLEERLVEAEQRVDKQRILLASIPRHLQSISCLLSPLLPPDRNISLPSEEEGVRPEETLEEGMRAIRRALGEREVEEGEEEEGGGEGEGGREGEEGGGALPPSTLSRLPGATEDQLRALQAKCRESETALEDVRFDLLRSLARADHLEGQLARAMEQLQTTPPPLPEDPLPGQPLPAPPSGISGPPEQPPNEETNQLAVDLVEAQVLCEERLQEIQLLSQQIVELKQQVEGGGCGVGSVPEEKVKASAVYLTLQAQFSVIQQDNSRLLSCVEELKSLLHEARTQHFTQLDEIRVEELKYEAEVREEMAQLEGIVATTRRDHELLRIEFEKRMASNDQAAPIAKELQVTVDSLQKTIHQLKSEVNRYKTRAHKAKTKLQEEPARPKAPPTTNEATDHSPHSAELQQLQGKVKTLLEEKRSLEAKLEGFEQVGQEEREKATLLANERRARGQVEEMKKKVDELRRDYEKRKEYLKEEANRKAKSLSEDNRHLQKELSAKKQEAQALVGEMECTAQAFEDMQEQNLRLLQQLKEREDANFKVISERIKASSLQKLLMEEKELLQSQLLGLAQEKTKMVEVMGRMEERERGQEATLQAMEKDMSLRQQALEAVKKKAMESLQSAQQLHLMLEEGDKTRAGVQERLSKKVEECEQIGQQLRRLQEEVGSLRRKLERHRTRECASTSNEVLLEEIRTYKTKLNCPCCSARKKDTVLTKCFHVFCSECIRSRYDSRLRKCPKCGAAFGANDFHKLYLS